MRQGQETLPQKEERKDSLFLSLLFTVSMAVAINMRNKGIPVGGITIYASLLLYAAMSAAGAMAFLVSPKFARIQLIGRQFGILIIPAVLPALWSHVNWIMTSADIIDIRRGYRNTIYLLIAFGAALALVYVAGEKAVWCNLLALLFANLNAMFTAVKDGGIGTFFSEFIELLSSFANTTGPLMEQMELHEITYAVGSYLIFFLLEKKHMKKGWPLFLLTLFCFLTGLKRIAVLAIAVGILAGWALLLGKRARTVELFFIRLLGIFFVLGALAYVGAVYYGFFDFLENFGIDTMTRAAIYRFYCQYFQFSPFFWGNGSGWVDNLFHVLNDSGIWTAPIHNDYLRMFIELGMIGFIIWCYTKCILPVKSAFRQLGMEGGIVVLSFVIYMAVTYMVDATVMYIPLNFSFAVIMMSYHLAEREQAKELEMERANRILSERREIIG